MRISVLLAAAALLASGCATMSGWQPVVDRQNDPHPEAIDKDLGECKDLAKQASQVGKESAKGGVLGALGGAAVGAALGAVTGDAGRGAATGAIAGTAAGAAGGGISADQQYKASFSKCMEERGHHVIN